MIGLGGRAPIERGVTMRRWYFLLLLALCAVLAHGSALATERAIDKQVVIAASVDQA